MFRKVKYGWRVMRVNYFTFNLIVARGDDRRELIALPEPLFDMIRRWQDIPQKNDAVMSGVIAGYIEDNEEMILSHGYNRRNRDAAKLLKRIFGWMQAASNDQDRMHAGPAEREVAA